MLSREKILECLRRLGEALAAEGLHSVSAEYLLAMKLMSARYGEKDYDDISFLMRKLKINEANQAYDVAEKYFANERILPKTAYVIESILEEIRAAKNK